jgi:hypothetical protein
MIAYFTTAVFDQLYRKDGCTSADVAALRKAIYGRELTVRLSPHHLAEILLARKAAPQALSAQIRQALSFASLRSLLKPCEQLLISDIRDYAAQGAAGNPFLHGPIQNDFSSGIAELIESDGEEITDEFREALENAHRQKMRIARLAEHLTDTVSAEIDAISAEQRSFPILWRNFARLLATEIAAFGDVLDESRSRGLDSLLEIRTVRLLAALILSHFVGGAADAFPGELHHALSAAAGGGVLVTGGGERRDAFAPLASAGLLPKDFEAIGLPDLLGRIVRP